MKWTINQKYFLIVYFLFLLILGCSSNDEAISENTDDDDDMEMMDSDSTENNEESTTPRTEIRSTKEGYRIYFEGEPLYIDGAGVDKDNIELLAQHGANSLRTWSMEDAPAVLDQAEALGLKVMMGIWVGLERHGFDYDNDQAVKQQLERITRQAAAIKDHPALLLWGVGNEVNLHSTNPKVWDAVNDISKMLHDLDPHHLTTTCLSGIERRDINFINSRASDLDFVSVQLYAGIEVLPQAIQQSGYTGPLLITEWGATGYWEVPETNWGAPLENNSSVKADFYLSRYEKSIATQPQVMGSYVFLWGQKQERTPTWFGMFMPDGSETESVDVMHYVWNGEWPENRSPRLHNFSLEGQKAEDNITLSAGGSYTVQVECIDPEGDELVYIWEIRPESTATSTGGDSEYIPEVIEGLFIGDATSSASFNAPNDVGAYRLFVYIQDGNNHTAHANIPFWVN